MTPKIKLFAKDRKTNEEYEITENLYFFEEVGIQNFNGEGHFSDFDFRFVFEKDGSTYEFRTVNGVLEDWTGK